jgi:hypothetical protein
MAHIINIREFVKEPFSDTGGYPCRKNTKNQLIYAVSFSVFKNR